MKKNLLAIFEKVTSVKSMLIDAKAEKEKVEDKLFNLINKDMALKEKIEARKQFKDTIDYLNNEVSNHRDKIKYLNMYLIALKAEAIREVKTIIAQNFIDNFNKIDGVPARYKKVKNLIDCFECEQIGAYYNDYYENIEIYVKGESSIKEHLYIFKKVDGEAVTDLEKCQNNASYTSRTPQNISENLDNFINAQVELEKAKKEYEEKIEAIKTGCYCLGLEFNGRY